MVCRLFTSHVSAASTAVGCAVIAHLWPGYGLYGCAINLDTAPGRGRVSICQALGEPSSSVLCGVGERFTRRREFSCLFRRTARHYFCSTTLPKRIAIPVRLGPAWERTFAPESLRTVCGGCRCSPRYAA